MNDQTVGIIGCGTMGSAIAERLKGDHRIVVFDKDTAKTGGLAGIDVAGGMREVLARAQTIILATKPQDLDAVLSGVRPLDKTRRLISIAAGIPTAYIEERLGRVRVVRVMPNLAIRLGKGVSALAPGRYLLAQDLSEAAGLFSRLGTVVEVPEPLMNAVTAVSGSGPGFFFELIADMPDGEWERFAVQTFVPALADIARQLGFPGEQADVLARGTAEGSLALLREGGASPGQLRDQVASRGGTTEAGLNILREGGTLEEAVQRACLRAQELSRR